MTETSSRRSDYARLLDRAIRILAMRDHSEQELRRKLAAPVMSKNGPEALDVTPEEVDKVVEWCIENRYLDDERFVRQFIASRSRKGYGPARVRQELKYGDPLPSVFAEKVKIQRFLLYRGYLMEDIQEIWRNFAD